MINGSLKTVKRAIKIHKWILTARQIAPRTLKPATGFMYTALIWNYREIQSPNDWLLPKLTAFILKPELILLTLSKHVQATTKDCVARLRQRPVIGLRSFSALLNTPAVVIFGLFIYKISFRKSLSCIIYSTFTVLLFTTPYPINEAMFCILIGGIAPFFSNDYRLWH